MDFQLKKLLFVQTIVRKEADKLESSVDDPKQYYIIEEELLVNTLISVPKEHKKNLNCAAINHEGVLHISEFVRFHKLIACYRFFVEFRVLLSRL